MCSPLARQLHHDKIDWESITITDNYMFVTVFSDPERCRRLLERLLGMEIRRVEIVQGERQLKDGYDVRGIRMDVYAADGDTVYNIEMQTTNEHDLERRSRYILSSVDRDCMAPGMDFADMSNAMAIFVCTFDYFKRGLPRYTVVPCCREDGMEMNDGSARVFLNSEAWEACGDSRLRAFLRYLSSGIIEGDEDGFLGEVDGAVRRERDRYEWRDGRMQFEMILEQERIKAARKAREEGRAEGREKGLAEGREEGLAEGREEGLAEAHDAYRALAGALAAAGRADELVDAFADDARLDELLREFGIA